MSSTYANAFCKEYGITEADSGDYELHCPLCNDVLYAWDDVPTDADADNVDYVEARHNPACPGLTAG